MKRTDLFFLAHSGLRVAMFDTSVRLAQTDFAVVAAADATLIEIERVLGFLREHAQHEDHLILPVVRRHCPGLASGLGSEHQQIEGQEARLQELLRRMRDETGTRPALAPRLLGQWHRFLALQLTHMQREEEEANRVLHAHCTDRELEAVRDAILSTLTPERRADWTALILPALPGSVRADLQQRTGGGRS